MSNIILSYEFENFKKLKPYEESIITFNSVEPIFDFSDRESGIRVPLNLRVKLSVIKQSDSLVYLNAIKLYIWGGNQITSGYLEADNSTAGSVRVTSTSGETRNFDIIKYATNWIKMPANPLSLTDEPVYTHLIKAKTSDTAQLMPITDSGQQYITIPINNKIYFNYTAYNGSIPFPSGTLIYTNALLSYNAELLDNIIISIVPKATPTQNTFNAIFYAGDNTTIIAQGSVKMRAGMNPEDRYIDTILTGRPDGGPGSESDKIYGLGYTGPVGQTKEGGGQTSGTIYYVNYYYYKDENNNLGNKAANSVPIKGGPGTLEYRHKEDGNGHHYWSTSSSGSSPNTDCRPTPGDELKFYPVFDTDTTDGTMPYLPVKFPAVPWPGYRSEDGSKNNDAYYYASDDTRAWPSTQATKSMVSAGNNINLYLKWSPVKYTIRFNKGNSDGWYSSANTLVTLTKEYGKKISVDSTDYPKQNARLLKTGYLQYGWIVNGSKTHRTGDGCICTYSYNFPSSEGETYEIYKFTRNDIDDRWYNDNLSGIDVYPCWYPINHKVITHYYRNTTDGQGSKSYDFNIETDHLSIGLPDSQSNIKDTWEFLGWVQNKVPKGDGWEWGTGGSDLRNRGLFKDISDIGDNNPYSITYGVNSKSLTPTDWSDHTKNIHIYALWSVSSRWVYIDNAWRPTLGIWVYINNKWQKVDNIDIRNGNWKSEVNN